METLAKRRLQGHQRRRQNLIATKTTTNRRGGVNKGDIHDMVVGRHNRESECRYQRNISRRKRQEDQYYKGATIEVGACDKNIIFVRGGRRKRMCIIQRWSSSKNLRNSPVRSLRVLPARYVLLMKTKQRHCATCNGSVYAIRAGSASK